MKALDLLSSFLCFILQKKTFSRFWHFSKKNEFFSQVFLVETPNDVLSTNKAKFVLNYAYLVKSAGFASAVAISHNILKSDQLKLIHSNAF